MDITRPPLLRVRAVLPPLALAVAAALVSCDDPAPPAASPDGPSSSRAAADAGKGSSEAADVYADMLNALGTQDRVVLRGRIVREDEAVDPREASAGGEISQDEVDKAVVDIFLVEGGSGRRIELGKTTADDGGYIDVTLQLSKHDVAAGGHRLVVKFKGKEVGQAKVRLLSRQDSGVVIRSDVDKTYLDTDFKTKSGLLNLLKMKARGRRQLPGMEKIYQGLRKTEAGVVRPIVFLSGSPRFFKRSLEGKMSLDGLDYDGLVLKPFDDIVAGNLAELDLKGIVPALEEQVGYKLAWLLKLRLEVPAGTDEVLLGDDSEADVVVYSLYHRLTAREMTGAELNEELTRLGVAQRWRKEVERAAPLALEHLGGRKPVRAIYINETGTPNASFPVDSWAIEGVTRYHAGAWPLALDLFEEGLLSKAETLGVRTRLLETGKAGPDLDADAAKALERGFVQRHTLVELGLRGAELEAPDK